MMIVRWVRMAAVAAVGFAPAGCFAAKDWLIKPEDAATPYKGITLFDPDFGEEIFLAHDGTDYTDFDTLVLRFQHIRDDYYVVQVATDDPAIEERISAWSRSTSRRVS